MRAQPEDHETADDAFINLISISTKVLCDLCVSIEVVAHVLEVLKGDIPQLLECLELLHIVAGMCPTSPLPI